MGLGSGTFQGFSSGKISGLLLGGGTTHSCGYSSGLFSVSVSALTASPAPRAPPPAPPRARAGSAKPGMRPAPRPRAPAPEPAPRREFSISKLRQPGPGGDHAGLGGDHAGLGGDRAGRGRAESGGGGWVELGWDGHGGQATFMPPPFRPHSAGRRCPGLPGLF